MYQNGRLREVVNLVASALAPEELVYVKAKLSDYDEPFAPTEPPTSRDWDARLADGPQDAETGEMPGLFSGEHNEEAPLAEELPEVPLIRPEEIVDDAFDKHSDPPESPQAFKAMKKGQKPVKFPHAKLAVSEASDAMATYASLWSTAEDEAVSTEAPADDDDDLLDLGAFSDWDDD